jgi:hypothetical protein
MTHKDLSQIPLVIINPEERKSNFTIKQFEGTKKVKPLNPRDFWLGGHFEEGECE